MDAAKTPGPTGAATVTMSLARYNKLVTVLNIFTTEMNSIHAALDLLDVPKDCDCGCGRPLTTSERVDYILGTLIEDYEQVKRASRPTH